MKTPKTPMIAPRVVYHSKIPHRSNQSASGKKYGKKIKPISPNKKPIALPIAIRVINDGFSNMYFSPVIKPNKVIV